jgi:hypothetical protein
MSNRADEPLERALDGLLSRALAAPALPSGFRARLQSALARRSALDAPALRRELAREHDQQLAQLHSDFIRLRRRTLGMLIGVAFFTGVALAVALPWIVRGFGAAAMVVVPTLGAAVGVAIGLAAWLRRDQLSQWLL